MPNTLTVIQKLAERFENFALFYGHGTTSAWDEAVTLVLSVLQLPVTASGESILERTLTDKEIKQIESLADERVNSKKPLPYLTKEAYFFGLPFYVDERVLIPRSPIAELIEQQFSPWVDHDQVTRVLDLCTGSGAIAIACALAFEYARVDAVELDASALEVAQINIEKHEVTEQVNLIQSDLFEAVTEPGYDLIVSNPPYVSQEEMATLPQEYLYEPKIALEAEKEGLALVERILQQAADYLNDDGILVVEVGNSWEALEKRYPEVPFLWLEFEYGGEGVFLLTKEQLLEFRHIFL